MLIEGTGVVGVEIVLYQSDLDRVWILGGKCLAKQRVPRLVRCGCTCARRVPVSGSIAASSAYEPSFSYS